MRIWTWTFRISLLVLAIALLAGGLWGLAWAVAQGGSLLVPMSAGRIWLSGIALVLTLLVLWLVASVIRHVVLAPFGSWNAFGSTSSARLLGLGAAALCFPRAVVPLINAPIRLVLDLVRDLPEQAHRLVVSSVQGHSDSLVPLDMWMLRLTELLQVIGVVFVQSVNHALQPIPSTDVLLAVVLWALVGQAVSPADATAGVRHGLAATWAGLQDRQRQWVGLAAVFAVGGFLSIASIVAIPWLQEEKATAGLDADTLQRALDGLRLDPADLQQRLPDAWFTAASPLEAASGAASTPAGAAAPLAAKRLAETLASTDAQRRQALQRAHALRTEAPLRQDKVVQAAVRTYQTESALAMSGQERLMFHRDIQRQVGELVNGLATGLMECRRGMDSLDRELDFLARDLTALLAAREAPLADTSPMNDRLGALRAVGTGYERVCTAPQLSRIDFVPPDPGAGWGPFGGVAQWLLRTRSFALALITGMLGFGLLGAALSDIVRHSRRASAHAGVTEVGRVVVRGLSAAVVLFLAVKGGLAILTVGDQNPNAYVLFFSCLVGAVFSDDVWRWARKRFLKQWPGDGTGAPAGAPAAASAPAPAPAPGSASAVPAPAPTQQATDAGLTS